LCSSGSPPPEGLSTALLVTRLPGRRCGRIWNADRTHEGWRPYRGAGVYNTTPTTPDGITGGHYDHVHISVY